MLVDSAEIFVRSGKGGSGCVSFRREKFEPKGGPDGGDGGHGGSVYLRAVAGIDTLLDFAGTHHWKAKNGQPGAGKECTGKSGTDLYINLPPGTLVYDAETEILLVDLVEDGQSVCIARGGKGGRGNRRFASATNRTPMEFEPGEPAQERRLRLELKLIADVGIIGMPNAGKSTFLSRVSRARPKIAAYPFTTKEPNLGIAELSNGRRLVLADIPGLIEGAHTGAGLGDEFLRHIERTRVLLHLVDAGGAATDTTPQRAYEIVRGELEQYSTELAGTPEIVAASKIDIPEGEILADELAEVIGTPVIAVSAVTGFGLSAVLERLWQACGKTHMPKPRAEPPAVILPEPPHLRDTTNDHDPT